ncbi:MAG TPA: phasin family protein [Allosphingosinicella sp.]|nr:phasin family protein [Allosphingosinicella sp.]
MTLRQTIQSAPTKAGEIIARLANTSNNAVKTRESLFAELSAELTLYVDLEEQHLLPLLRKHAGTKPLAADAAKGNKELRARLAELAAAPKDDDAFLEKLAELKKGFQHYVRNERKELLPAVLKALDDEEASQLAADIEGGISEAESARREKKREQAAAAKREAERTEAAAEAEREAARAEKAARREAREAADKMTETLERSAGSAQETAQQIAAGVIEQTQQAASGAQEALSAYGGTVQKASEDLRAVSASTNIAATGLSQFVSAWFDWAGKVARSNAEISRRMLQSRSLGQLAEAHQEFVTSSTRNLIEGNTALLEIAQRTSKQALRPLEGQLAR